MEPHLQQHQSYIDLVHLSTGHSFQAQRKYQESTFSTRNMFNIGDHLSTVSNINYRTLADHPLQLSPEQLREKLRKQLEYYFSKENMIHDIYLQSQMDADSYVPISLIANFKLVKHLTHDLQLIIDVLKESPSIEVDAAEKRVRSSDYLAYLPTRKRCTIILRNVPLDATENEVLALFSNESCPVPSTGCERVLESNHSDCWYVTFNNEDEAHNAFLYLTRESISIRGQKIMARMKACLWQKSLISSNEAVKDLSVSQSSSSNFTQEPYSPVYIPTIPINHTNQTLSIGNLSQQQTAVKPRHVQVLQQYLPMTSNSNTSSHQHTMPPRVLFTANMQPLAMNYYPQTQYLNRNHSILPINFWYIPPTADSYSPMCTRLNSLMRAYNIQSKTRLSTASKSRNSTKSISNHVEHSNELHDTNSLVPPKSSNRSTIGDNQNSNNDNYSLNQISNDNTCTLKQTDSSISESIEQSTINDFSHQNN
ncbi:unnamed protein product [Rotaria socialis]